MPNQIALKPFKGIAIFTPGGDLVYCLDENKRAQWHLDLCDALQRYLGLASSPHFLVPHLTATVDIWYEPHNQSITILPEIYPFVQQYQGLLNVLFGLGSLEWQLVELLPDEQPAVAVIEAHRDSFPELWECHDLVLDISKKLKLPLEQNTTQKDEFEATGPILRLFVSGHSSMTEKILKTLQGVLEHSRYRPYTLQMIDVSKHPEQAEADQISATPTLIKVWPLPTRRLVGELDNPMAIMGLLSNL